MPMRIVTEISGQGERATVQVFVEDPYGRTSNVLQLPSGMADRRLVVKHHEQLLQRFGITSSDDVAERASASEDTGESQGEESASTADGVA